MPGALAWWLYHQFRSHSVGDDHLTPQANLYNLTARCDAPRGKGNGNDNGTLVAAMGPSGDSFGPKLRE